MLSQFTAILQKKEYLNPEVIFAEFKLVEPKEINFSAGQYIILEVPIKENQVVRRLYSIASPATEKNKVELMVKILPDGLGSQYLKSLKLGETVKFSGPAGLFTFKDNNKPKIFLATGTGLAPIRSMLLTHFTKRRPEKVFLFWGLKKKADVYKGLEIEFKKIQKVSSFKYFVCLSREEGNLSSPYLKGRIQQAALPYLKDLVNKADFYICGGRAAVEDLKNMLLELGVPKENLHFEKF